MKRRKKNFYFGFGPGKPPSKRERRKSRSEFQAGVKRKRSTLKKAREKEASTLFKQLQRDAKPQRAKRRTMTPQDEEAWRELLRSNPAKAEELLRSTMASKKRKRKKKNGKAKMPAGLRKYWAKMRAKKNPTKKKRRKRTRRTKTKKVSTHTPRVFWGGKWHTPGSQNPKRKRRRPKVKNYRKPRRSNPRPRRDMTIKAPDGLGPKGLKQFARAIARASGMRTRTVKR